VASVSLSLQALGANIFLNVGDDKQAHAYLGKIKQEADGSIKGANTSITRSGGQALIIGMIAVLVSLSVYTIAFVVFLYLTLYTVAQRRRRCLCLRRCATWADTGSSWRRR